MTDPLETELALLEQRIQRLAAGYRQARLETRRALQERDRLMALNNELRRRIEGIVDRVRILEADAGPDAAPSGRASGTSAADVLELNP